LDMSCTGQAPKELRILTLTRIGAPLHEDGRGAKEIGARPSKTALMAPGEWVCADQAGRDLGQRTECRLALQAAGVKDSRARRRRADDFIADGGDPVDRHGDEHEPDLAD